MKSHNGQLLPDLNEDKAYIGQYTSYVQKPDKNIEHRNTAAQAGGRFYVANGPAVCNFPSALCQAGNRWLQ